MVKEHQIVVVGGGYAGIHTVKALMGIKKRIKRNKLSVVLVDRNPYHFRKVKLFNAIVDDEDLIIPFQKMFGEDIDFVQGSLEMVNFKDKSISIIDETDNIRTVAYDSLILSLGSVMKEVPTEEGGITLKNIETAREIRNQIINNIERALIEDDDDKRRALLRVCIVGGGISGIETAAEIMTWLRNEVLVRGLLPDETSVIIINANPRLFNEAPQTVSDKIERSLFGQGITVLHNTRAISANNGIVFLDDGQQIHAASCIWTIGLDPNPVQNQLGLLLHKGRIVVDQSYRVVDHSNVYAIGDGAAIIDPKSGQLAAMTCKEAIAQAGRLASVIRADIEGKMAPFHEAYPEQCCVHLGRGEGFVWTQVHGFNLVFSGKLAGIVRKYTWDTASLLKK